MNWFTLAKIGLISNSIGAVFLIIGSDRITKVISRFVDIVGPTYGTYGQGKVSSQIKELTNDFKKAKIQGNLFNYIGYLLFITGFILQLL